MSPQEALAALARDLVEEIAAGRALELSRSSPYGEGNVPSTQPQPGTMVPQVRRGSGAVHPHLGWHLVRMPGDTISQHAYKHLHGPSLPPA
jgi:hypothetical protein